MSRKRPWRVLCHAVPARRKDVPAGYKRTEVIDGTAVSFASRLPALLAKWEPRIGVRVGEVRIKKMKTCWGSCNQEAGRVWLNLELAKKQPSCLEYILVHEMVHLIERRHNDRFRDLMDRHMPQWRMHRDALNRAPLAHAEWEY